MRVWPRRTRRPVINRFLKPETRYARRMARIARWDRPIGGGLGRAARLGPHAARRPRRLPARLPQQAPGLGARCGARPSRRRTRLARLKADGVRTIVNLRGGREHGSWQLQKEVCDRLGIHLTEFIVRSRGRAGPGDDPAGQGVLRRGSPIRRCSTASPAPTGPASSRPSTSSSTRAGRSTRPLRQLSPRFGHFRFAKTGILDAFFERYRDGGRGAGHPVPRLGRDDLRSGGARAGLSSPRFWSESRGDRVMRRE